MDSGGPPRTPPSPPGSVGVRGSSPLSSTPLSRAFFSSLIFRLTSPPFGRVVRRCQDACISPTEGVVRLNGKGSGRRTGLGRAGVECDHWPLIADRSGQQVVACTGWHPPLGGVGRDDTGARDCEGRRCGYHPVAHRRISRVAERGHPHGSEQFVPRRAVRFGDRGGRGVHVHLRPEMGAVMLWPSASAVGWLLMMTALILLARSGTARWEREQERERGLDDPLRSRRRDPLHPGVHRDDDCPDGGH
jgi:hypothetical protein